MLTGEFRLEAPAEDEVPLQSTMSFAGVTLGEAPDSAPAKARAPRLGGLEARPAAAATSAALPDQTDLSAIDSNRRHYFRSVARIGHQVAEALAYAHDRGVIHRDIKPSNLLLDAAGVVWVTDFGLAKTDEEGLTHTGDVLGTIRYMAPERFRGVCDVRVDLYSLGLMIYELLMLRPAFALTRPPEADRAGHPPGAGTAAIDRRAHPPGPGDDRPEGDRQGPARALPVGRRDGGGLAPVRGGPADPGAAHRGPGAGLALVAAQPGGRRPARLLGGGPHGRIRGDLLALGPRRAERGDRE